MQRHNAVACARCLTRDSDFGHRPQDSLFDLAASEAMTPALPRYTLAVSDAGQRFLIVDAYKDLPCALMRFFERSFRALLSCTSMLDHFSGTGPVAKADTFAVRAP